MAKLDKKKIELIILAAGITVFIFALIFLVFKTKKKDERKISSAGKVEELSLAKKFDYAALNEKFSMIGWERDPFFLTTIKAREDAPAAILTGIIWDSDNPIAIFGDRFMKAGEDIQQYRILEIKREEVILSDGEVIYELRIGQTLAFKE